MVSKLAGSPTQRVSRRGSASSHYGAVNEWTVDRSGAGDGEEGWTEESNVVCGQ